MIYLSTGANGAGKTLFSLYDCRELQLKDLRPVYYVEGRFRPLAPLIEEFGWKPCKFEEWQDLPDGSIIFCDEVQEDLPKRPTNGVVPDHIKKIAQHRVRGFDFFMQTPHPGNLDSFVTRIIGAPGWHRHFKRVAGAAPTSSELRWDAVNNQCEKHGSGKNAQISMRGFPREVYSWYQSAEVHTGKLKIPKAAIYLFVALPCIVGLFYWAIHMMGSKAVPVSAASGGVLGGPASAVAKPKTAREVADDYTPRFLGLMHTAPVYDKLTEPKRVPVAAACIMSATKGCKCFTQDATPYPIDKAMCAGLVEHGTFYAFQPEGTDRKEQEARTLRREEARQDVAALVPVRDLPQFVGVVPQASKTAPAPIAPPPPVIQHISSVRR